MNYSIKRYANHREVEFPLIGATTGKHWVINSQDQFVADFLFSPLRSVYKGSTHFLIIEPVHYNQHSTAFSHDEHTLNIFENGHPKTIARLTCRYPVFGKQKFSIQFDDKKLTLKGKNKTWSSPSLDTSIKYEKGGESLFASSKFLGPLSPDGKPNEFDAIGEIECNSNQWRDYIGCAIFFLEMEMVHIITKSQKR